MADFDPTPVEIEQNFPFDAKACNPNTQHERDFSGSRDEDVFRYLTQHFGNGWLSMSAISAAHAT